VANPQHKPPSHRPLIFLIFAIAHLTILMRVIASRRLEESEMFSIQRAKIIEIMSSNYQVFSYACQSVARASPVP
jgi:hypothetical protein